MRKLWRSVSIPFAWVHMKKSVSVLKSGKFYLHLAIILILISLTIYFTLRWLATFTNHGAFVVVPDFRGKRITQLNEFVIGKDIKYEIIDSIYDPREKPGIVLRQDPEVNSKVKHNRTVYLYVTGMVPPRVIMPDLIDRSERQARLIISSYGLKTGKVDMKKADCNGCVIEQLMRGRVVGEGTPIAKGSVIDLVIGTKDPFFRA